MFWRDRNATAISAAREQELIRLTTSIAELLRYLEGLIGPRNQQLDLPARARAYAQLSRQEQVDQLPPLYLDYEYVLCQAAERPTPLATLRKRIADNFPELAELTHFGFIVEHSDVSGGLCREFCYEVLQGSIPVVGQAQDNFYIELADWVRQLPEPTLPFPGSTPLTRQASMQATLREVTLSLHEQLVQVLGNRKTQHIFEAAYAGMIERYQRLYELPIILSLLPATYLSYDQRTLLDRHLTCINQVTYSTNE